MLSHTVPFPVTAPPVPGLEVEQHQHPVLNALSGFGSPSSLDPNAMYDTTDLSRKRGPSAMDGDRAMKAMKLEPQDESQPSSAGPSRRMSTSTHGPSGLAFASSAMPPASVASMNELSSIPPPLSSTGSSSRPQSSAGIPPHHPLALPSDPPHASHPLQAGVQYPTLESAAGLPPSATDFVSAISSSVPPTALPSTSFNPSLPGGIWRDPAASLTHHHQHSLSAGAVLVRIPETGMSAAGLPPPLQYPPPSAFHSPTRAALLSQQQSMPMPSSSSIPLASHHSVRSSRSSSFAHTQGDMPNLPYELVQARQAAALRSRPSSPTFDDDMDGDSDDELGDFPQSQYHSPSGGAEGTEAVSGAEGPSASMPPPRGGQRRMSRGSPSADGGSSSSGHANEVPQEYRAEVERIFFEFLNSICSNRTF